MASQSNPDSRKLLADYLARFQNLTRFTLVGPLVEKHRQFVDPVIFVDGGSIRREGGTGLCVGDGDSSSVVMDLTLDPRKDFSDLSFALGLLPATVTEVVLEGFLGGRRDHELFNFGEVFHYLQKQTNPGFVRFDQEVIAISKGQWQFELQGLFSLMAVESAHVELTGKCHYPITPAKKVAPLSSFGLSNIAEGWISIETSNPIFLLAENITEPHFTND